MSSRKLSQNSRNVFVTLLERRRVKFRVKSFKDDFISQPAWRVRDQPIKLNLSTKLLSTLVRSLVNSFSTQASVSLITKLWIGNMIASFVLPWKYWKLVSVVNAKNRSSWGFVYDEMLNLQRENFSRSSLTSSLAHAVSSLRSFIFSFSYLILLFPNYIMSKKETSIVEEKREYLFFTVHRCKLNYVVLLFFVRVFFFTSVFVFHLRIILIRICDERLSIRLQLLMFSIGLKRII